MMEMLRASKRDKSSLVTQWSHWTAFRILGPIIFVWHPPTIFFLFQVQILPGLHASDKWYFCLETWSDRRVGSDVDGALIPWKLLSHSGVHGEAWTLCRSWYDGAATGGNWGMNLHHSKPCFHSEHLQVDTIKFFLNHFCFTGLMPSWDCSLPKDSTSSWKRRHIFALRRKPYTPYTIQQSCKMLKHDRKGISRDTNATQVNATMGTNIVFGWWVGTVFHEAISLLLKSSRHNRKVYFTSSA